MKIVVVGAGGVGAAAATIAQRRDFFDGMVVGDLDLDRATTVVAELDDGRFSAARIDASDVEGLIAVLRDARADAVLNATDPRFNPQIFAAAFEARCTYLDMAATLSEPHPERPYTEPGVMLGDLQFAGA